MTTQNLSWRDAVLKVLREAGEPLHYGEVADRIMAQRLVNTRTATPHATVNSNLRVLVRETRRRSVENRVVAIDGQRGWYVMGDVAENVMAEEYASDNNGMIKVAAFGLFWRRDRVDWGDPRRQLMGQQSKDAIEVDFADQDGVYFLHDGREVMYVGKTFTPSSNYGLYTRLKHHHDDPRKTVYWDSFSWFGFRGVSENGQLRRTPENANFESVVSLIEAIFIETLLPRLNQQSGEGMNQAREDGLYFQSPAAANP